MTEKKQILKSASIISLVTIVSRVLGYVRDQRIVLLLGTSFAADSFVLAYRIPNLFRRLVGEGSMTASFIPVFTSWMREKPEEDVWDFANRLFWTLSLVAAALYRPLNEWQNLEAVAARITAAAGHRPLIVLGADETTLAMASLYLPAAELRMTLDSGAGPGAAAAARAALDASLGGDRVLWLVPDRERWGLADWLAFLGYRTTAEFKADIAAPAGLGRVLLECVLVRPGGRSFALFAGADASGPVAGSTERTCP